ncbi:MAG: hypothetical protein ACTJLM_01580 [Ehrlichia sp.]
MGCQFIEVLCLVITVIVLMMLLLVMFQMYHCLRSFKDQKVYLNSRINQLEERSAYEWEYIRAKMYDLECKTSSSIECVQRDSSILEVEQKEHDDNISKS